MAQFNSLAQLNTYVRKQVELAIVSKVNIEVASLLRDYVKANVYDSYSPEYYERTYQLLDSITVGEVVNSGNKIICSIFFDANKIQQINMGGFGNKHMSVYGYTDDRNNNPINQMIPYYMNYGTTGSWIHNHQPSNFLEDTIQKMKSGFLREELVKALKTRGITVL